MKATRAFFSICANLGLLAGAITPSHAIPPEQKSSSDSPQEEKKASQEQLKASKKREFKPGPCAFSFMENCITGPYLSASFAVGSSEASGSSDSTENYTFNEDINLTVNNSFASTISNDFSYGPDLGIGYDFGGIRAELSYNYSGVGSSSASISGTSLYTATNDEGDRFQISFPSSTTSDSLNYSSQRIIASLAVDIPTGSRLSPYLAGGIGPAWVSIKSSNINTIDPCQPSTSCPATFSTTGGTAIALALQAKAGLAYFISPRSSLFIEAVYDYTSSVSIGNTELDDFAQYSAKFGFRYKL